MGRRTLLDLGAAVLSLNTSIENCLRIEEIILPLMLAVSIWRIFRESLRRVNGRGVAPPWARGSDTCNDPRRVVLRASANGLLPKARGHDTVG
jgi:hypothetical protein